MTRMLSGGISIPKPPILHGRCMMCMVAKIEIFVEVHVEIFFKRDLKASWPRIWSDMA